MKYLIPILLIAFVACTSNIQDQRKLCEDICKKQGKGVSYFSSSEGFVYNNFTCQCERNDI